MSLIARLYEVPLGSGRFYVFPPVFVRLGEKEKVIFKLSCLPLADTGDLPPRKSKKASRQKKKSYYHN